jgi:micrococcal nuclease
MKVASARLLLIAVAAAAFTSTTLPWQAAAGDVAGTTCTGLDIGPTRSVARVLDGETVVLEDGSELRLIGALAPRAMDVGAEPGTWPAEIAAAGELRAHLLGRSIELAFGGERNDRYGRLQAHAFVRDGDAKRWVQGHLLEQGLARAYTVAGNRACADELLTAERKAREALRGLWADAVYQIRAADQPAQLGRYRDTFQLVVGRIVGVSQARGTIYLNFDADWRRGFSTSVRRSDAGLLGAAARNPKGLTGKPVRVRGWLQQREGPTIDLSLAGLIEVIDEWETSAGRAPFHRGPDGVLPDARAKPPDLIETGR